MFLNVFSFVSRYVQSIRVSFWSSTREAVMWFVPSFLISLFPLPLYHASQVLDRTHASFSTISVHCSVIRHHLRCLFSWWRHRISTACIYDISLKNYLFAFLTHPDTFSVAVRPFFHNVCKVIHAPKGPHVPALVWCLAWRLLFAFSFCLVLFWRNRAICQTHF